MCVGGCIPCTLKASLFPFLSVPNPRPGHLLPPHPGTGLPLPAPAQGQAMLCPQNHRLPEAPLHRPRGGFGGRTRQRRAPAQQDLRTRARAKARPVTRRSQQTQPHQHPHPPQPCPRRSSPQWRPPQVGMRGERKVGRAREAGFCLCEGERGSPEVAVDWVLGDRKDRLLP